MQSITGTASVLCDPPHSVQIVSCLGIGPQIPQLAYASRALKRKDERRQCVARLTFSLLVSMQRHLPVLQCMHVTACNAAIAVCVTMPTPHAPGVSVHIQPCNLERHVAAYIFADASAATVDRRCARRDCCCHQHL